METLVSFGLFLTVSETDGSTPAHVAFSHRAYADCWFQVAT